MMNKLFRSNSTSNIASRSSTLPEIPQEVGIINFEENELSDVDLKLGEWNIPKVSTSEIYKSSWNLKTVFKTDYHVRTIELVYGINKEYETCYLFNPVTIKAQRKKGHNILHIGLVQVGVKPLIRLGLNSSILLALRDTRHIRFNDSLLGTIETSLSSGPVHFDCFPDFTVHLHDLHVIKALTLNIKTHGTLMTLAPYPRSRQDLGVELQGVKTRSQVSTPCYIAKQDSVVDQDDDNSRKTPSPSKTDIEDLYQYKDQEPPVNHEIMALKKDFTPDLVALGKEFDSERNKVKREAYRANHTLEQKKEVLAKWQEFMKEISDHIPFFEYFENHFEWHKKSCVITKTNWTKEDTKEVVRSNHPPQDAITFKYKGKDILGTPFRIPSEEEKLAKKVIEQNNYTNQCLGVTGRQLDMVEEKMENKDVLQPGNPTLEIVNQKLEELVKKEPVTPSSRKATQLNVLSKQEELLLDHIEQISDPEVIAQKLSALHATLVRETSKPEPRIRERKIDLENIYDRFFKAKKKEVTVNDLQKEIKETKFEVRNLKQELTILKVTLQLTELILGITTFFDQRIKTLESTSHQGNEEGPLSQNPLDDDEETVKLTANMVQDEEQ
ncbi:hypothetical protein SO802_010297 [Lithocarpus litseifolius]|uniref:DUF7588 domain-containing protein n=1 Tax=Lithocarpus litseifolius TaxID=425828 RepID=A0AAW2DHP9_9ROSI